MKHPPTWDFAINRIEREDDRLDKMLKRNITPGQAIRIFKLQQRIEKLVERLENSVVAESN